jgi:hypothetical protein
MAQQGSDRTGFDARAESYGWSRGEAEEVWRWFEAGRRIRRVALSEG